ncbi:MAG: PCRF domain-containing protein, partial [Methylophaga sp.]|nr:PCRF domain-containing protein [Methylophaga sp.]
MKESIKQKLESLVDRHEEIAGLLAEPETMADQNKFRSLSQEYAQLEPVVSNFNAYRDTLTDIDDARLMLEEDDAEMREMAKDELAQAEDKLDDLELTLQKLMMPKDPN